MYYVCTWGPGKKKKLPGNERESPEAFIDETPGTEHQQHRISSI
jgi:hypothetical protein